MVRRRVDDAYAVATVARIAQRLAVLLAAGVSPATAWRYVGGADPPVWVSRVADAAALDAGEIPAAIVASSGARGRTGMANASRSAGRSGLAGLAAMWRVAGEAGAPLAPALRTAAAALRDAAAADRAAQIALAGPRATARVVVVMPVVAVVFGALLGYDTIGVLVGSPIGWACIAIGVALMLAARAWSASLVARAAVTDTMPGLELELLAIALSGGAPVPRARAIVQAALTEARVEFHGSTTRRGRTRSDGAPEGAVAAADVVAIAEAVGAPMGELLRAEADDARRDAAAAAMTAAARLETSLMVPLGVCVLPAFVVLGVVPLLVAVLSSTVAML